MIDIHTESLLTMTQAPKEVPGRPHVGTIRRWANPGLHGIKLETVKIGGLRYTSKEALQRFFERSTIAADGDPAPIRTASQRNKAIESAERELAESGI